MQERTWTSPIWYTPNDAARKAAKPGLTVAELKKQGALALDDAQLKDLMVDKSVWIENTVTGEKFEFVFAASGKKAPSAETAITGEKLEGPKLVQRDNSMPGVRKRPDASGWRDPRCHNVVTSSVYTPARVPT